MNQFTRTDAEFENRNSINKKRKGGRPRLMPQERRAYSIKVGFNEAQFQKLEDRASELQISESELIHRLVTNKEIKAIPAINKSALVSLNQIGNNINQIAKRLNIQKGTDEGETLIQIHHQLKICSTLLNGV